MMLDMSLEEACGQSSVDWALMMMEEGFDTPNLVLLAGATKPYNHFELTEWRDLAFQELKIAKPSPEEAVCFFAKELLKRAIAGSETELVAAMGELESVYLSMEHEPSIQDFALLHYAIDDLKEDSFSYHVRHANRGNINRLIRDSATEFIAKHDRLEIGPA